MIHYAHRASTPTGVLRWYHIVSHLSDLISRVSLFPKPEDHGNLPSIPVGRHAPSYGYFKWLVGACCSCHCQLDWMVTHSPFFILQVAGFLRVCVVHRVWLFCGSPFPVESICWVVSLRIPVGWCCGHQLLPFWHSTRWFVVVCTVLRHFFPFARVSETSSFFDTL